MLFLFFMSSSRRLMLFLAKNGQSRVYKEHDYF
jgi:hypothetical protein